MRLFLLLLLGSYFVDLIIYIWHSLYIAKILMYVDGVSADRRGNLM